MFEQLLLNYYKDSDIRIFNASLLTKVKHPGNKVSTNKRKISQDKSIHGINIVHLLKVIFKIYLMKNAHIILSRKKGQKSMYKKTSILFKI